MTRAVKIRSSVYLDADIKEEAKKMFKEYGVSLSEGINFLLKEAMREKKPILDIEPVLPDDPDYKLMRATDSEKSYTLEEVMKEFGCR